MAMQRNSNCSKCRSLRNGQRNGIATSNNSNQKKSNQKKKTTTEQCNATGNSTVSPQPATVNAQQATTATKKKKTTTTEQCNATGNSTTATKNRL
jgi:hypothetical protein